MTLTLALVLIWFFVALTLLTTLFINRKKVADHTEASVLVIGAMTWPIAAPVVAFLYLRDKIQDRRENGDST